MAQRHRIATCCLTKGPFAPSALALQLQVRRPVRRWRPLHRMFAHFPGQHDTPSIANASEIFLVEPTQRDGRSLAFNPLTARDFLLLRLGFYRFRHFPVRGAMMLARTQPVWALMAASALQVGCAGNPMPDNCSVTGPLAALSPMSAEEICGRFTAELEGLLSPSSMPEGLRVALTLHKRGAIDAVLSYPRDGAAVSYPRLTVDALDRALRPADLTRLAEAAAGLINNDIPDASVSRSGQ